MKRIRGKPIAVCKKMIECNHMVARSDMVVQVDRQTEMEATNNKNG